MPTSVSNLSNKRDSERGRRERGRRERDREREREREREVKGKCEGALGLYL